MAILCFTFWASEKLPSTLFFQTQLTPSPEQSLVYKCSGKFCRAHLHHFLSALAFIAKLLIYLKWKNIITQQRKPSICRSMATFSIHAFPMSQGPSCALTHPADLLRLVGQSHGCAQHRETPRENRGKTLHPRSCHRTHCSPGIFSQDISVLAAHFAPHYENCGGARKQLRGDGLRTFGGALTALRGCSYNKYPCASHSFC